MKKPEQLKTLRERLKISEMECANAIGVSIQTYRDYENDPRRMYADQLIVLAFKLGKRPAEIDWLHPYVDE